MRRSSHSSGKRALGAERSYGYVTWQSALARSQSHRHHFSDRGRTHDWLRDVAVRPRSQSHRRRFSDRGRTPHVLAFVIFLGYTRVASQNDTMTWRSTLGHKVTGTVSLTVGGHLSRAAHAPGPRISWRRRLLSSHLPLPPQLRILSVRLYTNCRMICRACRCS